MKERPILFSAPMVRAILSGTKTQTRRAWKMPRGLEWYVSGALRGEETGDIHDPRSQWWGHVSEMRCPYGSIGDRLWVREAFSGPHCMEASDGCAAVPPSKWGSGSRICYWADGDPIGGDWTKPRPSIHMPRCASRITLEITGVRVERLQDISEADAKADGAPCVDEATGREVLFPAHSKAGTFKLGYRAVWEQINGPDSWTTNPWVWVVEFKRVTP